MLRKDEQAIHWLRKSVAENPKFALAQIHLTAVLGAAGHGSDAREALQTFLSNKRARTRSIVQWKRTLRTKNPAYVATFERLTEGLRNAGMPE